MKTVQTLTLALVFGVAVAAAQEPAPAIPEEPTPQESEATDGTPTAEEPAAGDPPAEEQPDEEQPGEEQPAEEQPGDSDPPPPGATSFSFAIEDESGGGQVEGWAGALGGVFDEQQQRHILSGRILGAAP